MTQKTHSDDAINIFLGLIIGTECANNNYCGMAHYCIDKVKCISNFVKNKVFTKYLLNDNLFAILIGIYKYTYYIKNKSELYKYDFYENHFIIWEDEYGILLSSEKKMESINKYLITESN